MATASSSSAEMDTEQTDSPAQHPAFVINAGAMPASSSNERESLETQEDPAGTLDLGMCAYPETARLSWGQPLSQFTHTHRNSADTHNA